MSETAPRFDPDQKPSLPVQAAFWLFCVVTLSVILGMTPFTLSVDDVKILFMHVGGMLLLLVYAVLLFFRKVAPPPAAVCWTWILFLLCNAGSLLWQYAPFAMGDADWAAPQTHELKLLRAAVWTGLTMIPFQLSLGGFIFLGAAVLRTKKMVELALKFWITSALLTTLFGVFHYGGGMGKLSEYLGGNAEDGRVAGLHAIAISFAGMREMISTILNQQFFGNFLVMVLPVVASAVFFSLANFRRSLPGTVKHRVAICWLTGAAMATLLSIVCIWLTHQKSSVWLLPVIVVAFPLLVQWLTPYRFFAARELKVIIPGLLATLIVIVAMTAADRANRMISFERSAAPRAIMFTGAWEQFLDAPVLGRGPGSFRLYFPTYRSPDYHLHRISNVTNSAHNWVLDLLCELGIAGTLAYLAFLGAIARECRRALKSADPPLRVAVIGGSLGVLTILVGTLATPMLRWPVGAVSFHAMLGVLLGAAVVAQRGNLSDDLTAEFAARRMPWLDWVLLAAAGVALQPIASWQWRVWKANRENAEGSAWARSVPDSATPSQIRRSERAQEFITSAVRHYERAIELDPQRPTTFYQLAYQHNRSGRIEEGLRIYRRLMEVSPDYAEVHYNTGILLMTLALEKGEEGAGSDDLVAIWREAVTELERAAAMSNKRNTQRQLAVALTYLSDALAPSEESIALARRAGEVFTRVITLPASSLNRNEVVAEEEALNYAHANAPKAYIKADELLLAAEASERAWRANPARREFLRDAVYQYHSAAAKGLLDPSVPPQDRPRSLDLELEARGLALLLEAMGRNPLDSGLQFLRLELLRLLGDEGQARGQALFMLEIEERAPGFLDEETRADVEAFLREATPKEGS